MVRRTRPRKLDHSSPSRSASSCIKVFVIAVTTLCLFMYKSQSVIDGQLKKNLLVEDLISAELPQRHYKKYIVFRQYNFGQGAGNSISGLLAAHLLGDEFDRLVCIASDEIDLLDAFQPKNKQALLECPNLPPKTVHNNMTLDILLLNYGDPPNECHLRDVMADDSAEIVWFSGNTYPRWPKRIPKHLLFTNLYEPTSQLTKILSWWNDDTGPPHTVVHLRHGDSRQDVRQGLDMETLRALGKDVVVPGSDVGEKPFLVTNWLSWYTFFEEYYGWRHPPWISVQHSAMKGVTWADLDKDAEVPVEDRNLQLWADWYTIIMAQGVVLHTHSDFSLSACHWMNMQESRTIQGVNSEGELDLTEDWFRTQDVTPPLSKRTSEELEHCTPREPFKPRRPVKEILAERREHSGEQTETDHQLHHTVAQHKQVVLTKADSDSEDLKDKLEDTRREKQDFLRSKPKSKPRSNAI